MFLDFFDRVYVINLRRRVDRREFMQCQLDRCGIPFEFFEASEHTDGSIGLLMTMKRLFRHALSQHQNNVMILEDDAQFLFSDPVSFLKEVLPQLPKDYGLFYLGLNLLDRPIRMSENILKVSDCFSTHAIVYSKTAMEECLQGLERIPEGQRRPYDIFIREDILGRMFNNYCTFPMLATQNESHSDIENNNPKWGALMAMSFALHTKNMRSMATEYVEFCRHGHVIDGKLPMVNFDKFEVQHPELLGRLCDCGRFRYDEAECGCSVKQWEVKWKENTDK